ncbi:nucleoside triphosphate pyrophosphohydrolase [Vallitalea maricola]
MIVVTKIYKNNKNYSFEELKNIIRVLRSEEGCPWDKVQTHESLRGGTLEEVYEVLEAIDNNDMENLQEELGDMLLHVVFHSQIATDNENFNIDDVINGICEKLIRRHPHVFKEKQDKSPEEVTIKWNEIKKVEKNNISYTEDMRKVPKALPALMRAVKVQKKARDAGFDFTDISQVMAKVHEELEELEEAMRIGNNCNIMEEYGDLLFSMVNISRFLKLNTEFSLTNATEKFINRFEGIENLVIQKGLSMNDITMTELDKLWEQLKEH